jgi:hypothetical protein
VGGILAAFEVRRTGCKTLPHRHITSARRLAEGARAEFHGRKAPGRFD